MSETNLKSPFHLDDGLPQQMELKRHIRKQNHIETGKHFTKLGKM